ncbi:GIY-YIG nuclease family protein [Zeaxanthinibacter enoshimensis]|uniref:Putative endonuclease n=1 Tax=Zeaxanthinibacter enoshimensis TaxID=392009 RepID=A0A4R6TMZ2_9FLAO|nr:GIY-YIG nuclease family protein [Zeaxanthinibacter enoshimensis]TDQ32912.1 putative endonuclease [Zeaxanthinibacter enoshimensis]
MCFTYVLYSSEFKKYYVGISNDVEKRLAIHNSGKIKSTKHFIPWRVVHVEHFGSKQEARTREKYLKSAAGRRWRKQNIEMGD